MTTSLPSRSYSPAEIANWDSAVNRYNQIMNFNAAQRVASMNEMDLQRYSDRYNTASASPDEVLGHMFRWGGFRELVISGGLTGRHSALFDRLLLGKEPLPYAPPRYFGMPWYELFESNLTFECTVAFKEMSSRKRDATQKIYVFKINDCPWECRELSSAAARLVEIEQQWVGATQSVRSELWLELRSLLAKDVSFHMRFGHWENSFHLWLEARNPAVDTRSVLASLPTPNSTSSMFELPSCSPEFPLRWLLRR